MNPILKLEGIKKSFGGIHALKGISMSFELGEVHAIVGENGAGKSTFIKSITGAISPDSGSITIDGETFKTLNPRLAKEKGIEVIYQEFNLIDSLSAAENIFFGEKNGRFVDYKIIEDKAQALFQKFRVNINPKTKIEHLSPAQKQIVEILKAITRNSKIIIMDEPTAPLTNNEVAILFEIINELRKNKITIIYITHRLEEIFEIADRVSVFRDGEYIDTRNVCLTHKKELVTKMVGREVSLSGDNTNYTQDQVVLKVENFNGNGVKDVSLEIHKGEILGMFGLVGAKRTELARLIYGADKKKSGNLYINGKAVKIHSTKAAIENGIGLIPEDRKTDGCFLDNSIKWNISISTVKQLCKYMFVIDKNETQLFNKNVHQFKIKTNSKDQLVSSLSGGNQQKVVLAKTMNMDLEVIIFDEPTRGIDVGARKEIYDLMLDLASQGKAILMISSDMEELLHMSNRLLVISEGRLVKELNRNEFDREHILEYASHHVGVN